MGSVCNSGVVPGQELIQDGTLLGLRPEGMAGVEEMGWGHGGLEDNRTLGFSRSKTGLGVDLSAGCTVDAEPPHPENHNPRWASTQASEGGCWELCWVPWQARRGTSCMGVQGRCHLSSTLAGKTGYLGYYYF